MYRVWYSTESFADYIIEHTFLAHESVVKNKLYESDANNPKKFHSMPDHIRRILYLDSPDIIVEKDMEPIFSIEISTEAGTGHNAFQRFARIAASVENDVPAFYIYPPAAIITRKNSEPVWDRINPLIFKALEAVMSVYNIPALLYYFPSDYFAYPVAAEAPNGRSKGLKLESDFRYGGAPDHSDNEMQSMFAAINEINALTLRYGVIEGRKKLLSSMVIRERRTFMQQEFYQNDSGKVMSPITSTITVPTKYLMNYLSQFESRAYQVGDLLRSRENTVIYRINANFRGDPYPGALSAIDYLMCREGKTYEERRNNLVLAWGAVEIDDKAKTLIIRNEKSTTINDFFDSVKGCTDKILLSKDYNELDKDMVSRYYMQVRYGSTYSKVKHIRVYSYFADAILFPDGSLWRDG